MERPKRRGSGAINPPVEATITKNYLHRRGPPNHVPVTDWDTMKKFLDPDQLADTACQEMKGDTPSRLFLDLDDGGFESREAAQEKT
eukprot:COSAG02_NODE_64666_length_260_cov_0.596273_1_plen_86_part_11